MKKQANQYLISTKKYHQNLQSTLNEKWRVAFTQLENLILFMLVFLNQLFIAFLIFFHYVFVVKLLNSYIELFHRGNYLCLWSKSHMYEMNYKSYISNINFVIEIIFFNQAFNYMNSDKEEVLHKLEFKKITKNSPKNNFDECLNPPSFDESSLLFKSSVFDNNFKEIKDQQFNQFLLENCEKWMETYESTQLPASLQKKQIKKKYSEFSLLIQILFFMKYFLDTFNIVVNIFCGLFLPFLNLKGDQNNIRNALYFLIFLNLFSVLIQNQYSYFQIIKTKRYFDQQKSFFLYEITLKNFAVISFLLIYLIEKVDFVLQIISFYFFYLGYKMIEISAILLIIQRSKL